jgi:signal transduction histidine kinase
VSPNTVYAAADPQPAQITVRCEGEPQFRSAVILCTDSLRRFAARTEDPVLQFQRDESGDNEVTDSKAKVAASIEHARADLDRALADLSLIPLSHPASIGLGVHALNNYLNVTEVTVELLQLSLHDHADPDVHSWLQGLRHMTDVMHHTVGGLLHATAPGEFPLKLEFVNLSTLIGRGCDYYGRIAQRKQIAITLQSVGDVQPAWADRVAVAVVADNLLSNAVKFSRPGQAVHVQIMSEPGFVVCSVRDQGPGISLADQQKLFQKGVPLSTSPTDGEPSTGFGLALAKDFIDRMNGTLWCESEPGRGACFSFRLPILPR